ncbi:hypothetical protein Tco_0595024 [Tanacetum coccineum]
MKVKKITLRRLFELAITTLWFLVGEVVETLEDMVQHEPYLILYDVNECFGCVGNEGMNVLEVEEGMRVLPSTSVIERDKGIFFGGFLVEEDALEVILVVIKKGVVTGFSQMFRGIAFNANGDAPMSRMS